MPLFADRRHAGRYLAQRLERFRGTVDLVLALPPGGVPVAYEVAQVLAVPLDVFVVAKLGFPGREELAMGAVASGGVRVLDEDLDELSVPRHVIELAATHEAHEVERLERLYRVGRPPLDVANKSVVLVDDGLATAAVTRAAVRALRARLADRIVVAVPIGSYESVESMKAEADDVVCATTPSPSHDAMEASYDDRATPSDTEIRDLLAASTS